MQLNDMTLFRQQAMIDGQWRDAPNGDVIAVTNPANGEQLGSVPKMGADETREAIEAANRALPAWRALTAKERANILRRWFDLMMENQDDLARLMTLEQGKPLAEAKGEISYAASFIEWFAEEGKRIYGDTIPGHQADKRLLVIKQPIGVTAAITPWNFPAAMITRKAGPALAAGCTMVLKPASQTPFSALALAELANRAEKLQQAVEKLRIGDGLQDGVTTGPLIDEKAVAKVEEHIADAIAKGAKVVTGGKPHALGGNFFQPTILVNVPDSAKVAKEETFGPLAPLFRFKDEADVIAQANDTEFGLAAYFYARDLSRVFRVGEALEYGIIGINTGIISTEVAPFGGVKASGLGREGSKYGIEDYLEIKYMCIGL